MEQSEGEKCQRCGEVGEDRRTLWMACLYDMQELPMPLEEVAIFGSMMKDVSDSMIFAGPLKGFAPDDDAKSVMRRFYTLRVCKRCRGEWMEAIGRWFNTSK